MKLLVAFIFTLFSFTAYAADQTESVLNADCSRGAAFDSFQCFSKKLSIQEKRMDEAVQHALLNINSMWGKAANEELKAKLLQTQAHWKEYRDGQCTYRYYTKASAHPPSLSMEIAACKLDKTEERIKEIKNTFLVRKVE